MRRRFLADEIHGNIASLTGQNAAHVARVLRARMGQEYEIAGQGAVRLGKVSAVSDDRVEFELGASIETPEFVPIALLLSICKFDHFEWAVEKATELGVARIVPMIVRRTDAHLAKAAAKRVERWRRIAHESSQQARRIEPPEIADPMKLKEATAGASGLKILLSESETERSLRSVLEQGIGESVTLAIGPEGGWADHELEIFVDAQWIPVSLGPTVLRVETAVVSALAVITAFAT